MILDEIVIHNFGVYAERQKIALTPPSPEKPIVLFGGLNGHGKTTFLDALQLCLYGAFARISNRNGLSYQDYLSRCFHRGSGTKEAAIEIAFRHTVEGREDSYRLHRSWRMGKGGCKEHFDVLKNRWRDTVLAENWISQVDDLIPPNIANLFLFDGEQVESYATEESSMRLIETAIHSLLGLDIVDQLEKDLQTYSRRKRLEDKDEPARKLVEELEDGLKALRVQVADRKQEQAALQSTKLDPARKRLLEIKDQYRKLGGDFYEDRVAIESQLAEAQDALREVDEKLREMAASDLPLRLVRELLDGAQTRERQEAESLQARNVATVLEGRDEKLLEQMRSRGVDKKTAGEIAAYLAEDRDQRRSVGKHEILLDMLPDARNDLQALLRGGGVRLRWNPSVSWRREQRPRSEWSKSA